MPVRLHRMPEEKLTELWIRRRVIARVRSVGKVPSVGSELLKDGRAWSLAVAPYPQHGRHPVLVLVVPDCARRPRVVGGRECGRLGGRRECARPRRLLQKLGHLPRVNQASSRVQGSTQAAEASCRVQCERGRAFSSLGESTPPLLAHRFLGSPLDVDATLLASRTTAELPSAQRGLPATFDPLLARRLATC